MKTIAIPNLWALASQAALAPCPLLSISMTNTQCTRRPPFEFEISSPLQSAFALEPAPTPPRRPPYQTAGRVPSSRQRTETVAAARGQEGQDPSIAARAPSMPETRTPQNIPRKAWYRSLEGGRFAHSCCHPSPPRTHACRN